MEKTVPFDRKYILKYPYRFITISYFLVFLFALIAISFFSAKSLIEKKVNHIAKELDFLVDIGDDFKDYIINPKNNLTELLNDLNRLISQNFYFIQLSDNQHRLVLTRSKSTDKQLQKKISYFLNKMQFKKSSLTKHKVQYSIYNGLNIFFYKKIAESGYFFGVYKLPKKDMLKLKNELKKIVIIIFSVLALTYIVAYILIVILTKYLREYSSDLLATNVNTIRTMGAMIAKRDSETGEHNFRVTFYTVKIAENMNEKIDFQGLIKGSFLHDIGKIAISDNILLKPGKLTNEEFEIIKTHVKEGYEIIKQNKYLSDAEDIVLYHHEKVNGTGYLKGLKNGEIPLNARIFAVADVFDALTSKRPYKKALSFKKAMEIINADKGKHFCETVVAAFEPIAYEIFQYVQSLTSEELHKVIQNIVKKYYKL